MRINRYFRKGFRRPTGLVVGTVNSDGQIVLGWSLCDAKDRSNFSKAKARNIAEERLQSGYYQFDPRDDSLTGNIPHSLHDTAFWVANRVLRAMERNSAN